MANTLNLGNGNWATKDDSLLAYNSENGNFKPLAFNFTRASSATVVNKDGLIETVGSGEPRIDFSNDAKGALLLEPSKTNSFKQSNQFDTTWQISSGDVSVTPNQIGVGGSTNAWKLTEGSYSGEHFIRQTPNIGGVVSVSVYAKAGTNDFLYIRGVNGGANKRTWFNLSNGIVGTSQGISAEMISMGNGWYRCVMVLDHQTAFEYYIATSKADGVSSYQGDNGFIYIQFSQLEQGSYATSYIPTQGSAVTRVGESTINNLSNQVSLTEGVFYIDVTNLGRLQNANILTQNSTVNSVYGYIQTNNRIVFGLFANSVSIPITSSLEYTIGTRTKIAFHYKSGNSKLYVNGFLAGNSTDTFTIGSGFADAIRLIDNSSAYFAFPEKSTVKEFKIYNTALTDAELIALTK